jgi:hypothetical protein
MPHPLCVLNDLYDAHLFTPLLVLTSPYFRQNRSITMILYAHLSSATTPGAQGRSPGGTADGRQARERRNT